MTAVQTSPKNWQGCCVAKCNAATWSLAALSPGHPAASGLGAPSPDDGGKAAALPGAMQLPGAWLPLALTTQLPLAWVPLVLTMVARLLRYPAQCSYLEPGCP